MGASVIGVDMLLDFNSAYNEDPTLFDAYRGGRQCLAGFARRKFQTMRVTKKQTLRFPSFLMSPKAAIPIFRPTAT
jgi:hypothetical protein